MQSPRYCKKFCEIPCVGPSCQNLFSHAHGMLRNLRPTVSSGTNHGSAKCKSLLRLSHGFSGALCVTPSLLNSKPNSYSYKLHRCFK